MTLFFLFYKNCTLINKRNDTPRNRATMEKRHKTLVTTHYKELGQDGQFDDCTKDVLEELCDNDYSDVKEELEANLDTDYHLQLIDDSSLY